MLSALWLLMRWNRYRWHKALFLLSNRPWCIGFSQVGWTLWRGSLKLWGNWRKWVKLSGGSPGEQVLWHDWTQRPRGRQQPFCWGGLAFWRAHQMYRTDTPIMALWHMGSGEHPALMTDSANCSPVQVSGTYLLPNTPNYSYLFSWWQLYVSISETKTEGGSITHLQSGWDAESGCLPALCYPAGMQGLGTQPTVFAPALRFPRGQTATAAPRSAH